MSGAALLLLAFIGWCPLACCSRNSYLFVSSPTDKAIHYSRLLSAPELSRGDGLQKETLVQGGKLVEPSGLAFDGYRSLLYVADPGAETVFVVRVSTRLSLKSLSFHESLETDGDPQVLLSGVTSQWVAVDSTGDVLCPVANGDKVWLVPGDVAAAVANGERGALSVSGSDTAALELFSSATKSLKNVQGIASAGGRAFWANGIDGDTAGTVASAVIDVTDASRSLTALPQVMGVPAASGICIANSRIFYTDGAASLYSVPLSGGQTVAKNVSCQFQEARGCAYDGDGSVYVADAEAGKVYDVSVGSSKMSTTSGEQMLEVAMDVPGSFGLAVMVPNVAARLHSASTAAMMVVLLVAAAAAAK